MISLKTETHEVFPPLFSITSGGIRLFKFVEEHLVIICGGSFDPRLLSMQVIKWKPRLDISNRTVKKGKHF